jgi:hypothetical protein
MDMYVWCMVGYVESDDIAHGILEEIKKANNNIAIAEAAIAQYQSLKLKKEQCILSLKSKTPHQYERKMIIVTTNNKMNRPFKHNTKEDITIRSHILEEENKINDEIRVINTSLSDNHQIINNEHHTLTLLYKTWEDNIGPFCRHLEKIINETGVERKR